MVRLGARLLRSEWLLRLFPAAGASLVFVLVAATRPITPVPRGIAAGCAIAAWLVALALPRRELRSHASVALAIAAVTALGQVEGGPLYGAASALFVLGSLVSMRR